MELDQVDLVQAMPIRHQFFRMILAATAGFVAHKLVENAYDMYYNSRYEVTAEVVDV